ncbi:MAG: flagellar hook-basal body protein [Dehalococcoidia bacterium]|nr:flagellar hook-basal body protein [Dehalococcoidia bacterium]
MIKGIYASFTSLEAAWKYQDMLSNNISNASTTGFKREVAAQQSFADILLSQQTPLPAPLPSRIQAVVGQIGTGTFVADFSTDFAQGSLQATGNELDFALNQGFFQIETPDGTRFYTRDGHFLRDAAGDMVDSHGNYLLDVNGQHITLPPGTVAAQSDGTLSMAGQPVAQVAVLDFSPSQLTRAGEGYFTSTEPGIPVDGGMRQGYLEGSNTNIVEEMTSLVAVQRVFQANQTVLATLDQTLNTATTQLGTFGA